MTWWKKMSRAQLLKGTVEFVVLKMLEAEDMYGYQITKRLKKSVDEILHIREGVLYPMLIRMEKKGMLSGYWQDGVGKRKQHYYSITKKGIKELEEKEKQWASIVSAVREIFKGN